MANGVGSRQGTARHRPGLHLRLGASPFARLAAVHALMSAGDTLATMALAGSLFFSISPHAARSKVALYLLLTMAPFAVVAPLLGPALDRSRGGRRSMVLASGAGRVVVCLLMAHHLHSLLLFPEAFALLVLSKAYMVAKSALVPNAVEGQGELVQANSRLAVLAVVSGFLVAGPGALVLKVDVFGRSPGLLRVAAVVFAVGTLAGLRLPRARRRGEAPPPQERAQLHAPGILLAASAMAVLRGAVGFLIFLVAFAFRRRGVPSWWFGAVLAASLGGTFVGNLLAPRVRRWMPEERILTGSLLGVALAGLITARAGGRPAVAVLAFALGAAAGAAKLCFDAIVQRDAPEAARGRSFARFETRFQLVWVLGAFVPVVLTPLPGNLELGMGIVGFVAAFAAFSYAGGRRAASHHGETGVSAVGQVDPGQPKPGGVDLGGRGEVPFRGPQPR